MKDLSWCARALTLIVDPFEISVKKADTALNSNGSVSFAWATSLPFAGCSHLGADVVHLSAEGEDEGRSDTGALAPAHQSQHRLCRPQEPAAELHRHLFRHFQCQVPMHSKFKWNLWTTVFNADNFLTRDFFVPDFNLIKEHKLMVTLRYFTDLL